MQNPDIDSKIDWKQFYSRYFSSMKPTGKNKMVVKCPFHDDAHASMWFNTENGCWKCEACGESGNAQVFLEKIEGIDSKEAYSRLLKLAGEYNEPEKKKTEKFTIESYCQLKNLPVEFIASLGVKNSGKGIAVPYMDESGQVVCTRYRYANKMFSWKRGSHVNLYGLWMMNRIRELGYVILVEGESDSHTLWFHKIPALGVPGASTFQPGWVDYLKGLKIYIHKEPDLGGDTFLRKVCEGLFEKEFEGNVYQISIPGYKDPSELHIHEGEAFDERWKVVIESAQPVDIQEVAVKVDDTLPGAPVQLRAPAGWRFTNEGISMINDKTGLWVLVCRTPLLLSRRMKSLDTGEEKIEIAYQRDKRWQTAIVQRSTIFQSRTIPQLSDIGITVTSENAKLLVKYLGALEAENIDILKVSKCVSQLGWYGKNFLPGLGGDLVIDVDRASMKWVNAYSQEGTFDEWIEKMKPFRENNLFRFILASAFAAPLLKLLNHRIFLIHNWGDSRSGKTAALKAALSVWGDPEELMANFNATKVGLERLAGFFNDLPLGIDEKQVAGNRQDFIESIVYMLSIGTTKVRGAKSGGLQAAKSWRCIVLTTGEEPLTQSSSQTGVYTRTLEVYGSPFNGEDQAKSMHDIASSVYGHAGPRYIEKLIKALGAEPNLIKDAHEDIQRQLAEAYPGKMGSHISSVAVVATADQLISDWIFGESDGKTKSMDMALQILGSLEDKTEADVTDQAYEFIREWTMSNEAGFSDKAKERLGYYDADEKTYYIFPHVLEKVLAEYGYSYRKTLKTLGDRGQIGISYSGTKKQYSVIKRFDGKPGRFIEIHFDDIEESAPF